jgi:hypothetical protein
MKLRNAVKKGDVNLFVKLLETHYPHPTGYNILHETIARGEKDMARHALGSFPELIHGADYPYCNTPLMYAIFGNDMDMIRIFDDHLESYSIPNVSGRFPLHMAIAMKDLQVIRHVYEKFPRALSMVDDSGQYPLHIACQHGCPVEIVRFLYDADQDVPDKFGNYPIHLFGEFTSDDKYVEYREDGEYLSVSTGVVDFLTKKNSSVMTKQNKSGNTPLHQLSMLYVSHKSVLFADICRFMTPDILHIKNNQGMLPVHIASFYHDVHLAVEMIAMCPETIYDDTLTRDNILDMWELASVRNMCHLVSLILSLEYPPREELWKFIPKPLQYFEKYLHAIRSEHRERCVDHHISKKARADLRIKMLALSIFSSRNSIIVENELITTIVLKSM